MEIRGFRSEFAQIIKMLLIPSSLVVVCVDFESANKNLFVKNAFWGQKYIKVNNHCCHLFIVPKVSWPPDVKNWLIWKVPDAGKD